MERTTKPVLLPHEAETLLQEVEQLDAWEALAATDDLRSVLSARRATVAVAFARAVLRARTAPLAEPAVVAASSAPVAEPPASQPPVAPAVDAVPQRPALVLPSAVPEPPAAQRDRRVSPSVVALPSHLDHGAAPRVTPPGRALDRMLGVLRPRLESPSEAGGPGLSAQDPEDSPPPPLDPRWGELVDAIVRAVALAPTVDDELDAILRAVEGWDRWRAVPADAQRLITAFLAARLHVLQEAGGHDEGRVGHGFSQLSAFMKRARPGFVHGLARGHRPTRGSWAEDAEELLGSLEAMLPPPAAPAGDAARRCTALANHLRELATAPEPIRDAVRAQFRRDLLAALGAGLSPRQPVLLEMLAAHEDLLAGPELRAVRRALAAAKGADDGAGLPVGWAWRSLVQGKRVAVVGGVPRPADGASLQRAFGFASLVWWHAEPRRGVESGAAARIARAEVDIVLLLRAVAGPEAEREVESACRSTNVLLVPVDFGWGPQRVRQAIERCVAEPVASGE